MDKPKTRKPHKKSRNGCVPCKTRHIKCDEQRPKCVNCDKYGAKCEYPTPKRRRVATEDSPPSISVSTPSSLEGAILNQIIADTSMRITSQNTAVNIPQLQLLHHFTTVTSKTLPATPAGAEVYANYVVKIAFSYPFLLHAILAVGALHLSRLDSSLSAEYLLHAGRHYDAALVEFRSEINDVDQTNFQAVLIFAKLQFPYGWATTVDNEDSLDHALDRILSNMVLTRRVRPIVAIYYNEMKQSELGRLVPEDVQDTNWMKLPVPEEQEISQLRKFSDLVQHLYPPDIIEAYSEAISVLQHLFSVVDRSDKPPSDALLTIFIVHVTSRFMELLSEKQPGALIIFSYYAVLLGRSQHYWFLEGVADQIMTIADTFVPLEWKSWLAWPREQIKSNPR